VSANAVLGVDIGTSSSKGVLVDGAGRVLASTTREHEVARPVPGHVEMAAEVWWDEFISITRELLSGADVVVSGVGVSGMGPCAALADADDRPVRPAILYGVDTRAGDQIAEIDARYGPEAILARCGSALTSQAVGPKIAWVAEHEPAAYARARRLYMPSSYLVRMLTGRYILDHHSASQSVPLYDTVAGAWYGPWWSGIAGRIEQPALYWSNDIVGTVSTRASAATGLTPGIPVIAGTVDAWAEAASAGAVGVGDLMLMYGTTMFLVDTVAELTTAPPLWSTVGVHPGTRNLAGGMATSGAITSYLNGLFGRPGFATLVAEAEESPRGANGLLLLPYFAGERTPISDPDARGIIAGLTVGHTRGDLYRAALEGTAFGVRHNIEAMTAAGAPIEKVVAVGGGTQGGLWTQIVSDVTGRAQQVPRETIGASYGVARLAAEAVGFGTPATWNPVETLISPDPATQEVYHDLYRDYLQLYPATRRIAHDLSHRQMLDAADRRSGGQKGETP
jgi:xylulokinase